LVNFLVKIREIIDSNKLPVRAFEPISDKLPNEIINEINRLKEQEINPEIEELLINFPPKISKYKSRDPPFLQQYTNVRSNIHKRKRNLIVDEFIYYISYHYDPKNYGIYFRANHIGTDFRKYLNLAHNFVLNKRLLNFFLLDRVPDIKKLLVYANEDLNAFAVSFFIPYIIHKYSHGLAHHVIEDIATALEARKKDKYPLLKSKEEEAFCEYVAFTVLGQYIIPGILYKSRKTGRLLKIFLQFFPMRVPTSFDWIIDVSQIAIIVMYIHYNLLNDKENTPKISYSVSDKLSMFWKPFWLSHYTFEREIIEVPKIGSIFSRIFLTKS